MNNSPQTSNGNDSRVTVGSPKWFLMLLRPGIGLKRWLFLLVIATSIIALGVSFAISFPVSGNALAIARTLTLSKLLPNLWRGALFITLGGGLFLVAGYMFYRRIAFAFSYLPGRSAIVENLSSHLSRSRGPKIVVFGGGTGLSNLLKGLKVHSENITAVVTVADDGGSSGRLRAELGVPPPGDARQCLIALSDSESLMEEVLAYRFSSGSNLQGHSLGNLLLAALTDKHGNMHEALESMAKLLAVKGRVMPATNSTDLKIFARTDDGTLLEGETAIGKSGKSVSQIWSQPDDCEPNPFVLSAVAEAEIIVIGPGSLYTSILPNFLIPGIVPAVKSAKVPKIFVCNLATQEGETDNFTALDHWNTFVNHSGVQPTHFLVNGKILSINSEKQKPIVTPSVLPKIDATVVSDDLIDPSMPTRHDPLKLANAIIKIVAPRRQFFQ